MNILIKYKWFILGPAIACSGIFLLSRIVNEQINSVVNISSPPVHPTQIAQPPKKEPVRKKTTQKSISRSESKSAKNSYTENIITVDGSEIARFKREDGKVFDVQGQIPDGTIEFTNKWKSTHGFENFRNGKRDGPFTIYYQNDRIHSQGKYKSGRLQTRKSYYHGGMLHMEEDYTNANFISTFLKDTFERVGSGKIYRLTGTLKYEWHVTDDSDQYYTKRYNSRGELIQENFYDKDGKIIKKENGLSE